MATYQTSEEINTDYRVFLQWVEALEKGAATTCNRCNHHSPDGKFGYGWQNHYDEALPEDGGLGLVRRLYSHSTYHVFCPKCGSHNVTIVTD